MLNRYPIWKYLIVLLVLAVGFIYALPNLYPEDPAIQISGERGVKAISQQNISQATSALEQAGIDVKATEINQGSALIRLEHANQQLSARSVVTDALGEGYVVALNLADSTPDWLRAIGAKPMKLGLDLRGGVHFLLEVDMDAAVTQRMNVDASAMRETLRDERIRYRDNSVRDRAITFSFLNEGELEKAEGELRSQYNQFEFTTRQQGREHQLVMTLTDKAVTDIQDYAVKQNLTTIRNRVNELGVSEPLVQRQGPSRIVVELPGVQDTAAAKRVVGATANLEFRLEAPADAQASEVETFGFRNDPSRKANLSNDVIITGDSVSSASQGFDQNGQPQVNINLDGPGGSKMNRATRSNIGKNMAVLYIEHKSRTRTVMENGKQVEKRTPYTEKGIISLATIQSALGNRFRITGLDSPTEASELSLLLRSGSLAAPIYFAQERTIGPSLGQENINRGVLSVEVGLVLVVLFMLLRYKAFGLIANTSLAINLSLLIAAMSLLGATLTLPGIAGIVLTLGMAVDANVLIYERIREELRNGMSPQQAIHAGYERAFTSILDANITTLLVALILFSIGTGPVKGFAVTLSLGILTSMFTGIMVSRAITNLTIGGKSLKKLWI
ncbi:protein translocase subunit SecD [Larsenimonas rhizosphaerae]|uniref:Protein translocase subunit SecD n=1 Tax=Larsenimonas rhizosphaerae TaxID=2944682 RepID=A0AA42CY20_9GAMM|nr:protein translocase subunit SecD [Larsenimonas rhizosphaerae]MCM2129909.1 protein translocase subunit SecD [Larsenimonas rhizosphaerae]MCX2524570.1 protein translocase subunit SecD [Larsenimonas rhizosphaerae]